MNNHTPYCIFCGMGCDCMEQYDVWNQNTVIGSVIVQNSGLFTEFNCSCRSEDKDLFRVVAQYDDKKIDLGICVLDGEHFTMKRLIPTKNLGSGTPRFYLAYLNQKSGDFVPLFKDKKCPCLHKIDQAKYLVQDGVKGLSFTSLD